MPKKYTLKWKRPESIEYPKVWHRFQARDLDSDNLVEYRIEDLVGEKLEDAFQHMRDNYFKDEPVSAALGGYNDPELFEDYKLSWDAAMAQKTVMVCYREGSDEIVGLNWVFINTKEDTILDQMATKSKSPVTLVQFGTAMKLYETFNVFEHYGVDKFMTSTGLSVNSKYRGRSIGDELLGNRKRMCKAFGVKVTHTLFTSNYSSRNAENVGFQRDAFMSYADVQKLYPNIDLSAIKHAELNVKGLVV